MLALAFLMTAAAAAAPAPPAGPWYHARHRGAITLTAAEIRRLSNALVTNPLRAQLAAPARAISHIQHWSSWRRAPPKAKAAAATTSADSPPTSAHNEMTLPR